MYLNIYRLKSLGGGRLDWSLAEPPPGWLVPEAAGGVGGWGCQACGLSPCTPLWCAMGTAASMPMRCSGCCSPQATGSGCNGITPGSAWCWKKETGCPSGDWIVSLADALGELLQRGRQTVSQSIFSEAHQNQPRTGWVLHMVPRVLCDLSNQP